jgi:hypothetical protein
MKPFLIQTFNNEIQHDFSWHLIQSIKYQNWYSNTENLKFILSDTTNTTNCIPIGSVEFVHEYLLKYYNIEPKPINIPFELQTEQFLQRKISYGTKYDIKQKSFVKSTNKIKSFTDIVSPSDINSIPGGDYLISELIDIQSEYRCFIYQNKLVGLQNYSGDFTVFPDVSVIYNMISEYKSSPIVYTLDVGIVNGKTVIIEVHNFYSCGLYGFSEYKILPQMFIQCFNELTKK